MAKKRDKKLVHYTEDDAWVREHFEELVEKYAGKYVAVSHQQVAGVADSPLEAEKEAMSKYPHILPSVLPVPRPEDFISVLIIIR